MEQNYKFGFSYFCFVIAAFEVKFEVVRAIKLRSNL